jgi:hypothetical protein
LPDQQRAGHKQQKNDNDDIEHRASHRPAHACLLGTRQEFDANQRAFAPDHPAAGRFSDVF